MMQSQMSKENDARDIIGHLYEISVIMPVSQDYTHYCQHG